MTETKARPRNFKILPATPDDFLALAEVEAVSNIEANQTPLESNVSYIMFSHPSDVQIQKRAEGLEKTSKEDPAMKSYKAVVEDENGREKIVAWAQWGFYTEIQPIKEWENIEWSPPANGEACNHCIGAMTNIRKKYMTGKRHAYLQVLATLPEYRCQGIGSALLKDGIAEAKEKRLDDFFLTASADGHDLYVKFGFKDIELVEMDIIQFGGVGNANVMAMGRFDSIEA
ncbi:hypothetical protein N7478_011966 [Penicillium angulare]|uniref:uncharacterized protein n=1 Tax=Penicillium angulare TaxID=116970 RepID=UPI0025416629|nr:uncharacterized protein N7478_011966 [Penicillium angulare]KAJ5261371.1 hypothetical protein N7478_011966 [Penicillium angulare]